MTVKALKSLPCFNTFGHLVIIPIDEGYSQSVYKVFCYQELDDSQILSVVEAEERCHEQHPSAIHVAKQFNNVNAALLEAELAHFVATLDRGLTPIFHNEHWLVSDFATGTTLENTDMLVEDKAHICLSVLSTLHKTPIGKLQRPKVLNIDNVLDNLISSSAITDQYKALIRRIVVDVNLDHSKEMHTYIHGDANFSNVIFDHSNSKISINNTLECARLIDFEAVSIAPIAYELGMMCAINRFPIHTLDLVSKSLDFYKQVSNDSVTRYCSLSCIINALWFYEEYGENNTEKYRQKAIEQFKYLDNVTNSKYQLAHHINEMR